MWIKPSPYEVIFVILLFVYGNFFCYQLWFHPQKWVESERKSISQLPKWYPLREFFLEKYEWNNSWINQSKVMAIGMEIFLVMILILHFIAWFYGK